jgi:hypothetical protein
MKMTKLLILLPVFWSGWASSTLCYISNPINMIVDGKEIKVRVAVRWADPTASSERKIMVLPLNPNHRRVGSGLNCDDNTKRCGLDGDAGKLNITLRSETNSPTCDPKPKPPGGVMPPSIECMTLKAERAELQVMKMADSAELKLIVVADDQEAGYEQLEDDEIHLTRTSGDRCPNFAAAPAKPAPRGGAAHAGQRATSGQPADQHKPFDLLQALGIR